MKKDRLKSSTRIHNVSKKSERRLVEYFVIVSSVERERPNEHSNTTNNGSPVSVTTSLSSSSSLSPSNSPSRKGKHSSISSSKTIEFDPVITSRYPLEDHHGNPLSESITCFCHPSGAIELTSEDMSKCHYFVTTGGRGAQLYGVCLTLYEPYEPKSDSKDTSTSNHNNNNKVQKLYLPKCLCILSAHPYLVAFREWLSQLDRLAKSGDMTLPIERYISNFCSEIPAPPPGAFEVQTTILDSTIKFWSPPHNQPIAWISLPYTYLFECLDIENIVKVWHALVLERQVLITSTQLSLLTVCCESLISFLFPMRWSHAYIPVLPHFLMPILSAPMPYLCGLDKKNLADALEDLSPECIVVDLDTNHIHIGPSTQPLPPIPHSIEQELRQKLNNNVSMIYREVRSLKRDDDYSGRGEHLNDFTKKYSDDLWESKLCLYDAAFHLSFTPEQAKNNFLNGNDNSGIEIMDNNDPFNSAAPIRFMTALEKQNLRKQSRWDSVQEAFLTVFVNLLKDYRKCLVFPSKDGNDPNGVGSYGGAGFRSKDFVQMQKYAVREFMKQFIATQMFDDFVTKRLYGSGAADVIFFDQAIDKLIKRGVGGGVRRLLQSQSSMDQDEPLLQSSRVHRKLKTIVPPEPSGLDLPFHIFGDSCSGLASVDNSDELSVGSASTKSSNTGLSQSTQGTANTGLSSIQKGRTVRVSTPKDSERKFTYETIPSTLKADLFGEPRPLSSAVLAEFDRQRRNAAQFNRRLFYGPDQLRRGHVNSASPMELASSPEVATFSVFFLAYTAVLGKELLNPSSSSSRTILSTYNNSSQDSDSDTVDSEPRQDTAKGNVTIETVREQGEQSSVSANTPKERFRDTLTALEFEEAKATAKAQLGLAFDMLKIMRERGLKADPLAYQCLIDACGRCGDTDRATFLLARMHEDGIVADGVVYSCLVSAFSVDNNWSSVTTRDALDIPEWANGASVDVDWNKLQKRSWRPTRYRESIENNENSRPEEVKRSGSFKAIRKMITGKQSNESVTSSTKSSSFDDVEGLDLEETYVTESVLRQIILGENLLEVVYPDICIDTDNEYCPRCNTLLTDNDVVDGWSFGNAQDYTTKCPVCPQKFVPHFCIQSSSDVFVGSRGPHTPLLCERLSPWVLEKELRLKMSDREGIEDILDPTWRDREPKNSVLFWNLILSFMRYRFPFTFLLQGSFQQNLIGPTPDDGES